MSFITCSEKRVESDPTDLALSSHPLTGTMMLQITWISIHRAGLSCQHHKPQYVPSNTLYT